MKKILVVFALITSLVLTGCASDSKSGTTTEEGKALIGISMPTKDLERWEKDGDAMKSAAESKGYEVDIQYANNDVATQVSHIENMITKGAKLILIAPIDGAALTDITKKAQEADIKIISYDRLITGTEAVDYYATFDLATVGKIQGEYIEKALDLENQAGPFNIELFGGAPDDNNAPIFFKGAMDVLQKYIDSEKLVVKSNQTDFNQVATQNWDGSKAQQRMDNLLSANYTSDTVHAVLTQNDALARGVISSLKSVGYGSDDLAMPVITGQDAETASVKAIASGEQAMTVFKDTSLLASAAIDMADAVLNGKEPTINDTETFDNGKKVVPTYYLQPVPVDKENFQSVLVDSGYIDAADLQ
ncbi:MAG: multiple monosaccharide ABC transporter substrate-binding protein [Anaerorhabdus sp.]